MPKIVDYPLASFDKVKELADAVDYLGGSCSIRDCAEHMKKKVSGGFGLLISSAIKHDLIIRRRDRLFTSELYRKIKLSYNEAEKLDYQRNAFFHPVLYKKIFERFRNKELPLSMLDKLLIREFQVKENVSQKIAGFFIDGVKRLQLLREGKLVGTAPQPATSYTDELFTPAQKNEENKPAEQPVEKIKESIDIRQETRPIQKNGQERYVVHIIGNGLDSTIVINDYEDYLIVETIMGKIKKTLS